MEIKDPSSQEEQIVETPAVAVDSDDSQTPTDPDSDAGKDTDSPDPSGDKAFQGAVEKRYDEVKDGLAEFKGESLDKLLEANPKVQDAVVSKLGIEGVDTAEKFLEHAASKALEPLAEGLSKLDPDSIKGLEEMDSRLLESLVKSEVLTIEGKPAESVEAVLSYLKGEEPGAGAEITDEKVLESAVSKIDDLAKELGVKLSKEQREVVEKSAKESLEKFSKNGVDNSKFDELFDMSAAVKSASFATVKKDAYKEGFDGKVNIQKGQEASDATKTEHSGTKEGIVTMTDFNNLDKGARTAYITRFGTNFKT